MSVFQSFYHFRILQNTKLMVALKPHASARYGCTKDVKILFDVLFLSCELVA